MKNQPRGHVWKQVAFILTGATCLALAAGCQVHKSLRLEHTATDGGALKGVPATKVNLAVLDERPAAERESVAKVAKVTYIVEGGVIEGLESGLRSEFEKAGHQVIKPGAGDAPVLVQVALQRFLAGYRNVGGGTALEKYAEINAEVRVSRKGEAKPTAVFPVSVRQSHVYPLGALGGMAEVVAPAYQEFIKNVTMEPRLIEALTQAK
jgi:hypothetical protein